MNQSGKTSALSKEIVEKPLLDSEILAREVEEKRTINGKTCTEIDQGGEQTTTDIKTEASDLPTVQIKTEPEELDCFKEAEQALRRLSSRGNEENVTFSVEVVNAGGETVYVKHEVGDVEMAATTELGLKQTESKNHIEVKETGTSDVYSRIEEQCDEIQRNEEQTNVSNLHLVKEETVEISVSCNKHGITDDSQQYDKMSPELLENLTSAYRNSTADVDSCNKSKDASDVISLSSVIHNSQASEKVVHLGTGEEESDIRVRISDTNKLLPHPDDDSDADDDDNEDSEYMVLAEWTDGKEEETLPPGEKENVKQDKGSAPYTIFLNFKTIILILKFVFSGEKELLKFNLENLFLGLC